MPDKNYISYADQNNVYVTAQTITPPDDTYQDALKFSKVEVGVVSDCVITSGDEDAIDMNRYCLNCKVERGVMILKGKYGITIKGGCRNITLSNVIFRGHGKETDIDIGNWSDQSADYTEDIKIINCKMEDGSALRVRTLWAKNVTIVGDNVKVTRYPLWIVWVWRVLRKWNWVS